MTNEENKPRENTNFAAGSGGQNDKSTNNQTTSAGADSGKNSTAEAVENTAKGVLDQAKDSAGHAYGLAADKATSKIEEQKSNLSSGLSGVADSIRQVGQTLRDGDEKNAVTDLTAKYGETVANQIENLSGYFENRDLKEIVRDVESFARRQPAIFIAAAFATGLLAARFLKSSADSIPRPHAKLTDGNANSVQHEPTAINNQTALDAS